jgi:hypothetical protein
MATRTEEVLLRVSLNQDGVTSGTRKLIESQKRAAGEVKSIWDKITGVFTATAILGGINAVINKFDDLQDRADNLGVGTDFLQGIGGVAKNNAVGGIETFNKAISELSQKLGDAKNGGEKTIAIFKKYGITLKEIRDSDSEQMFYLIADRIAAIEDPAKRTSAAFELLGKSGKNLTGVLSVGADGLRKMGAAIDKLDAQKIKDLAEARDRIEEASTKATIFAGKVLGGFSNLGEYIGKLSMIPSIGNKLKDVYDSDDAAQTFIAIKKSTDAWRESYNLRLSNKQKEADLDKELIASIEQQINATVRLRKARHDSYIEKVRGERSSIVSDYNARKEFPSIAEIAGRDNMDAIEKEFGAGGKSNFGKSRLSAVATAYERAKADERESRRMGWAQRANEAMLKADRMYGILQTYGAVPPKERLSDLIAKVELTNTHLANLSVTIKGTE